MSTQRLPDSADATAQGTGQAAAVNRPASPDAPRENTPPGPAATAPTQPALAEELEARQRESAHWQQAFKDAVRDREIASQLAGRPLVAGAAAQLVKLWREEFEVEESGGVMQVRSRDGAPLEQAIAARLASPEYAHFSRAAHRGGAGLGEPLPPAGSVPAEPTPRTLGDAVIAQWRIIATRCSAGPGPVGLNRRRR